MGTGDNVKQQDSRAGYVISADAARIAYETFGEGVPILFIGGMLSDRSSLEELARDVGRGATSVVFDRRGRGDSEAPANYSVMREVEDVRALAGLFDKQAILFGHSSGAGLAIEAAASGMSLRGLILYEPPYGPDDASSRSESTAFARSIEAKLKVGDRPGALTAFFEAMGLSGAEVEAMATDPNLIARAPTMLNDFDVMGQFERGGIIPVDVLKGITTQTLVLTGARSPPFFAEIASEVASALPNARLASVLDADHTARSDRLPDIVLSFLSALS